MLMSPNSMLMLPNQLLYNCQALIYLFDTNIKHKNYTCVSFSFKPKPQHPIEIHNPKTWPEPHLATKQKMVFSSKAKLKNMLQTYGLQNTKPSRWTFNYSLHFVFKILLAISCMCLKLSLGSVYSNCFSKSILRFSKMTLGLQSMFFILSNNHTVWVFNVESY